MGCPQPGLQPVADTQTQRVLGTPKTHPRHRLLLIWVSYFLWGRLFARRTKRKPSNFGWFSFEINKHVSVCLKTEPPPKMAGFLVHASIPSGIRRSLPAAPFARTGASASAGSEPLAPAAPPPPPEPAPRAPKLKPGSSWRSAPCASGRRQARDPASGSLPRSGGVPGWDKATFPHV